MNKLSFRDISLLKWISVGVPRNVGAGLGATHAAHAVPDALNDSAKLVVFVTFQQNNAPEFIDRTHHIKNEEAWPLGSEAPPGFEAIAIEIVAARGRVVGSGNGDAHKAMLFAIADFVNEPRIAYGQNAQALGVKAQAKIGVDIVDDEGFIHEEFLLTQHTRRNQASRSRHA